MITKQILVVLKISSNPITIRGGYKPGEKVVKRLDISAGLVNSRKKARTVVTTCIVIFLLFLIAGLVSKEVLTFLILLSSLLLGIWLVYFGMKSLITPEFSELIVTNQRLLLRAGPRCYVWVSNYDCSIEILVREEFSALIIRPISTDRSPAEVYIKSSSPSQMGFQLSDLFRTIVNSQPLVDKRTNAILRTTSSAKVPPGIAVTHAFLSHQLRSIVSAIPLPSFSAIDLTAPRLPVERETPDLGAIGYQFGVDGD